MTIPFADRPPVERDVHTDELPPLPQRDLRIDATRWIEAPEIILTLGDDLGPTEAGYLRRIGPWLLWRAGPPSGGDARYGAVHSEDLTKAFTFRLFPDGSGAGFGPDGVEHTRFRTWKESLRDTE
ncbi:MAG: hypothetical protein ACKOIA_10425 [Acidimicrobiia bacterium]